MQEMRGKIFRTVNFWIISAVVLFLAAACDSMPTQQEGPSTQEEQKQAAVSNEGLNIAYVKIDTIINNYELFYELSARFDEKSKQSEAELQSKSRDLETKMRDFQNKVQKGLVTRATAAEMEQELMQEQQTLMQRRDELRMELAEEEQVMQRQLINEISEYLEDFNSDGRWDYIFSYSFGTNLLYVKEAFDITDEVLKGLNEDYKATAGKE